MGQFTSVTLPVFNLNTVGTHTLSCFCSNPNHANDQNTSNNQSVSIFKITSAATLPVLEGFENNALPSTVWEISHTASNGLDFTITSSAAASGIKSAMINNTNNPAGNISSLQTAASYDLSSLASPSLSFKVAYQKNNVSNNDKLQVLTSSDCGANWISRWARWSPSLSTASATGTSAYIPGSSDFVTYTVNISALAADQQVQFRWDFYADPNGPGNNLYLDDINISDAAVAGVQNIENNFHLNLYPNPSTGFVFLAISLTEKHNLAVEITDMLGRTMESIQAKSYDAGESILKIGSDTFQKGIYLAHITIDRQLISRKIVIE